MSARLDHAPSDTTEIPNATCQHSSFFRPSMCCSQDGSCWSQIVGGSSRPRWPDAQKPTIEAIPLLIRRRRNNNFRLFSPASWRVCFALQCTCSNGREPLPKAVRNPPAGCVSRNKHPRGLATCHMNLTFPSQVILLFFFILLLLSPVVGLAYSRSTSCPYQQRRRCATSTQKTRFLSKPRDGTSS